MSDIKLRFINESGDRNNSTIVIFQKNQKANLGELAVAWTVIQNCGHQCFHPFTYPMQMFVSAADSYGNYTPQLAATNGDAFSMVYSTSGDILQQDGASDDPTAIDVNNNLELGAIGANIYKDGKLLAAKTNIMPGDRATFQFNPVIYIGAVSQISEGDVMKSAVVDKINTKISLEGLISADIVMTGGGSGAGATAYKFALRNALYL